MRLLALPFLIMLAVLVIWPLASIVNDSFLSGGVRSLDNYRAILFDSYYRQSFVNGVGLSLVTTAIGMALGFLTAVCLRRRSGRLRRSAMAFANIGANFAGVPLAMAIIFLFGMNGAFTLILKGLGLIEELNVYSLGGLIVAYSYFQVALASLLITPLLDAVGRDVEEAAMLMGSGPLRFWLRIGLPGVARQMVAIAILLFANAMGTYATTAALTGTSVNVVTIRISELVSGDIFSDPNLANAIAMLLLAVLLVPIALSQVAARERRT